MDETGESQDSESYGRPKREHDGYDLRAGGVPVPSLYWNSALYKLVPVDRRNLKNQRITMVGSSLI